jgi:hypothetical protein
LGDRGGGDERCSIVFGSGLEEGFHRDKRKRSFELSGAWEAFGAWEESGAWEASGTWEESGEVGLDVE